MFFLVSLKSEMLVSTFIVRSAHLRLFAAAEKIASEEKGTSHFTINNDQMT